MEEKPLPTYAELLALVARLEARIASLEKTIAAQATTLAERDAVIAERDREIASLKKNSRNSSKPPYSDFLKPQPPSAPKAGQRRIGGQPGHARHERQAFTPKEVDAVVEYAPACCPDCGRALTACGEAVVLQQAELAPKPVVITEHRATPRLCPHCGRRFKAELPAAIRAGGLCGGRASPPSPLTSRAAATPAPPPSRLSSRMCFNCRFPPARP